MLMWRAGWKDWGFAPTLFVQAKQFLDLAKHSEGYSQEGYIRASIVFFLMSFEAYWRDVIRGHIQTKGPTVDQTGWRRKLVRTDLKKALEIWPQELVGAPLPTSDKFY